MRLYNENMRLYLQGGGAAAAARAAPAQARSAPRPSVSAAPARGRIEDTFFYYLFPTTAAATAAAAATGPTEEQIAAATETIEYHAADGGDTICPISLEAFQEGQQVTRIRECGHYFCAESLARWFNNHSACPVCRHNITGSAGAQRARETNLLSRLLNLLDTSGNLMSSRNVAHDGTESLVYEFEIPANYRDLLPRGERN